MKNERFIEDMTFEDYRDCLARVSGYTIDSKQNTQHDLSDIQNWKSERTEKIASKLVVKHYLDLDTFNTKALMISNPLDIKVKVSNAFPTKTVINPVLIFTGENLPTRFITRSKQQGFDDVVEVLLRADSIEYLKPYRLQKQQDYCVIFSQGAKLTFGNKTPIDCQIVTTKNAKDIRDKMLELLEIDGMKEAFLVS